jgi:hypothetical protein
MVKLLPNLEASTQYIAMVNQANIESAHRLLGLGLVVAFDWASRVPVLTTSWWRIDMFLSF